MTLKEKEKKNVVVLKVQLGDKKYVYIYIYIHVTYTCTALNPLEYYNDTDPTQKSCRPQLIHHALNLVLFQF